MGAYIQQGFGKGTKVSELVAQGLIEGIVLSPFDETPVALARTAADCRQGGISVLFDPQAFVFSIENARPGRHPAFGLNLPRRARTLDAQTVTAYVARVIAINDEIGTTSLLAPSVIQRGFRDGTSGLALQMAATTAAQSGRRIYASAILDERCLDDWRSAEDWLDGITGIDDVEGVYLVASRYVANAYPYAFSAARLTNLMRIVHRLAQNQIRVIAGYSDIEGLALIAAGADAAATGWSVNRRILLEDRWRQQTGGVPPPTRLFINEYLAPLTEIEARSCLNDQLVAQRLSPSSISKLRSISTVARAASQSDYLREYALAARMIQNDHASIDGLLEGARREAFFARNRIASFDAVYVSRLDSALAALRQFRLDENL